jgi:hypothetical protein
VNNQDLANGLKIVAQLAQGIPEPVGRLVAALALFGERAIELNPSDPVKVVEDASLAAIEAAVAAKFG